MDFEKKYRKAVEGVKIAVASLKTIQNIPDEFLIKNTLLQLTEILDELASKISEKEVNFEEFKRIWLKACSCDFYKHQQFLKDMGRLVAKKQIPKRKEFTKLKKISGGKICLKTRKKKN